MEVTTSAEALRRQRAALGGSATTRAATRLNAEQASKRVTRKPTRLNNGEGCSGREASDASTDRFRRGSGGGTCGRGDWSQHGKPCRWRGTRQDSPRGSGRAGQGGGEVRRYRGSRVMPAEGRAGGRDGEREQAHGSGRTAYHPGDEQECRMSSHAQAKGTTRAVAVARASTGLTTHRPAGSRVQAWCQGSRDPSAGRPGSPCASRMIPLESPVPVRKRRATDPYLRASPRLY